MSDELITAEVREAVARALCRAAHISQFGEEVWREGELDSKVGAYWQKWLPQANAALSVLPGLIEKVREEAAAEAEQKTADAYIGVIKKLEVDVFNARTTLAPLSDVEGKHLLSDAERLWEDLQTNDLGGYSGINRPFYIVWKFREIIERYGRRNTGLEHSEIENATIRARTQPKTQEPVP